MEQVINWIVGHNAVILGALFGLSEILALIPWVKSNSVFQLVFAWLRKKKAELPQA